MINKYLLESISKENIKSFHTASFTFVDYTEMNCELSTQIWEARNLPGIRQFMTNSNYITYNEHTNFIDNLRMGANKQYLAVIFEDKLCGSVNLNFVTENTVERGIFILPVFHRKGLAKRISEELYRHLFKSHHINIVYTKVLISNDASIALQKSLGALLINSDQKYNYYSVNLSSFGNG